MSSKNVPGAYLLWDNDVTVLRFDAITSEVQERTNLITEHPVESGANISDHIRPNLNKVTIEAFVSNSPTDADGQIATKEPLSVPNPPPGALLNGVIDAIGGLLNPMAQVVADVLEFQGGATDFVAFTIDALQQIRGNGTIIKVVCPNATYESMILEGFEVHRDPNTGDSARFNMTFREIRIVSSSLTDAPQPTVARTAPTQDKGHQASETPDPTSSSLLSKILDSAGVGL